MHGYLLIRLALKAEKEKQLVFKVAELFAGWLRGKTDGCTKK